MFCGEEKDWQTRCRRKQGMEVGAGGCQGEDIGDTVQRIENLVEQFGRKVREGRQWKPSHLDVSSILL